jgi:hypothetical protein
MTNENPSCTAIDGTFFSATFRNTSWTAYSAEVCHPFHVKTATRTGAKLPQSTPAVPLSGTQNNPLICALLLGSLSLYVNQNILKYKERHSHSATGAILWF